MKKSVKITLFIFSVLFILLVVSLIIKKLTSFNYEKNLDNTVITVDGTDVSLREFGYYIFNVEEFVQAEAMAYDSENPTQWWNTHFSADLDSAFVCDYAKDTAIQTCVSREIYCKEAKAAGFSLDATEEAQAISETNKMYQKMNADQKENTGLNKEIILECEKKKALASKYATYLSETIDFSAINQDPAESLNWDGDYYTSNILPKHDVQENGKILDNITLGKITVNYD